MVNRPMDRLAGIVTNVSWTSLEQILRVGLSFLVTVQVINYLGAVRFGLYSYVISIVSILIPLTAFGLEPVLIRCLVERPADRDRLLGTTFVMRVFCSLLSFVMALAIVLIIDHGDAVRLRLTAIAGVILLVQATDTVAVFFKAIMGGKQVALARLAGLLIASGGTIILLIEHACLPAFLWMRALETSVTGGALFLAYIRWAKRAQVGSPGKTWRFDTSECRSLLKSAFPLCIASFAVMVYMRIDQLMLGQMSSDAELGYYSVAVRLAEVLNFIPGAIVIALYPSLVDCQSRGTTLFDRKVQGLFNLMVLIGYGVTACAILGAPLGFRVMFGQRYDAALPMFNLLVASMVFVCLGVATNAVLTATGRFWTSAIATIVGMLVNVALNYWLIPRFGAIGSAWATLASYWVVTHGALGVMPTPLPIFRMICRAMLWPDIRILWSPPLTSPPKA